MAYLKHSWMSIILIVSAFSAELHANGVPKYKRSDWKHWIDADKNCKNTREEALVRDSSAVMWTGSKCTPVAGIWHDSYYDQYIFLASNLDADHIIPLEYAHYAGGWKWSKAHKQEFANDLLNVVMVSASANRSKGSKGPSKWVPVVSNRCEYVRNWTSISLKYNLTLKKADSTYIRRYIKDNC